MRKLASVVAAVIAIGAIPMASAADLPVKAPFVKTMPVATYNWTGFYLGLEGGWAHSDQRWTAVGGVSTGNFSGDGGLVGLTAGYNWQTGMWVFGAEGDISWADIKATDSTTGGCSAGAPCTAKIDWLGTIRGRVGLAADRWLFYVTGGAAFADVKNSQLGLSPLATATTTAAGWTVGGGIEAALWGNWSAKVEYLYVDIGQTDFCPAAGCGVTVVSDYTHLSIVRGGLNLKF